MKMKKIVAMMCALCMIMAIPAMAAEPRVHPILRTLDEGASNVMVTASTVSRVHPIIDDSDVVLENLKDEIEPMATTVPTTYAPASWYNVNHYWTAKYYTWSSYIFTCGAGRYFDCYAKQPFSVAFFYADGTEISTWNAQWNGENYVFLAEMDGASASTGYYVKIINNDDVSISNDAYYKVWS